MELKVSVLYLRTRKITKIRNVRLSTTAIRVACRNHRLLIRNTPYICNHQFLWCTVIIVLLSKLNDLLSDKGYIGRMKSIFVSEFIFTAKYQKGFIRKQCSLWLLIYSLILLPISTQFVHNSSSHYKLQMNGMWFHRYRNNYIQTH